MTLAKLIEDLRTLSKDANRIATELERIKRQSVELMVGDVGWNGKPNPKYPEEECKITLDPEPFRKE